MLRTIEDHLSSTQVTRVVYGAIVGLAVVVAMEDHAPAPAVVAVTLLGTAVAVGLAELFSDLVGTEARMRRPARRAEVGAAAREASGVTVGVAFSAMAFVLAAARAIDEDAAFAIAKWSGVALLTFYGACGARLAGRSWRGAVLRGLGAGLIGAFLVALKALTH